jgi:hypothetical protein
MVLVHEFLFDDLASAKAAMSSAAGQAAGQALMALPGVNVTLVLAEHLEEARQG